MGTAFRLSEAGPVISPLIFTPKTDWVQLF
jgi:hypothetical protein